MKKIILAMIALCVARGVVHGIRAADHRQHHRPYRRRPGRGGARRHRDRPAARRRASCARDVSDGEGIYRLTALPVGSYDVTAELSGSRPTAEGGRRQRRADDRHEHRAEARRGLGDR